MSGRSWIVATPEQCEELLGLSASSDREEADRARAMLLSLEGWTSERIAAAFCARPDSVRHWRWIFGREGVAGLRARKAPGPEPVKARAALTVVEEVLAPGVSDRPNWTLPRLADEIEKRTGQRISKSRLSVVLRKRSYEATDGRAPVGFGVVQHPIQETADGDLDQCPADRRG
jgi:transposase